MLAVILYSVIGLALAAGLIVLEVVKPGDRGRGRR